MTARCTSATQRPQGGGRSGPPPRPQARALGRGDLHGGRCPGPRVGPLLPAGCDKRVPELRVAGEVPREPRAARMANDGRVFPDPVRRA